MKKGFEFTRMILASPEILAMVIIAWLIDYFPNASVLGQKMIDGGDTWKLLPTIAGIPLALLITSYKLGDRLLSLQGKRAILIKWPDYWRLKIRVLFSLIVCGLAVAASVVSYFVIRTQSWPFGLTVIVCSWAAASASTISVALAIWRAREILGE